MPRKDETKKKASKPILKRAGIYCRVSTRGQGESGVSLANQERKCKNYCDVQDYEVVDTYIDVQSAKDLDRPQMARMRKDIRDNKLDIIVALKLDRISRVPRDFYNLTEELDSQNKGLVLVQDKWDTSTSYGKMLVGILIQFAAFERDIGIERTKAAGLQRALSGLPGGGVPPLGYDRVDKEFIVNEEEASIIKRIYSEYLTGIGPQRIAEDLNKDGFRNKKHFNPDGTFRNGGKEFTKKHIYNFITNCLYCGRIHYNGERFPGKHEPIISEKDWNDAQKIVRINSDKKNRGNTKRDQNVLAGLLTCGICGDLISKTSATSKTKKTHHYLHCKSAGTPKGKRNDCDCRRLPYDQFVNIVAAMIREIANTDGFLKAIEKEFIEVSTAEELEDLKAELQHADKHIADTNRKIKNLIEILAKGTLDDTSPIEEELESLNKLKREKTEYRDSLKDEISQKEAPTPNAETLVVLYKEFDQLWDTFSDAERRMVLNLLIDGIEINYPKDSDKGKIILNLYHEPPVNSLHEITEGSYVYLCQLRRRDLNSQPSD